MSKLDWRNIRGGVTSERELIDDYEKRMLTNISDKTRRDYMNGIWSNDENRKESMYKSEYKSEFEQYQDEIRQLRSRLHELESEKNKLLKEEINELKLRFEHTSVQEAWEQYQIVKKLVQE